MLDHKRNGRIVNLVNLIIVAVQIISIEQFLALEVTSIVIDVRSPSEFAHARIPDAYNIPIFSDEERKIIGTAYKQESKEIAIKLGLDFYGPNMRGIVEKVQELVAVSESKTLIVHCWRGGMRSNAIAWLLDFYGFEVLLLEGGYKKFRLWGIQQFEIEYNFNIIGGFTGSGKTLILDEFKTNGEIQIDLEGLASHKGSALGAIGQAPQPSQEMFENSLALKLFRATEVGNGKVIYIEDESQRIGQLFVPLKIHEQMRKSNVFFLTIPFEVRLTYLVAEYGNHSKELIIAAIERIQKRLGGLETNNAIAYLVNDDTKECFRILLNYYDRWYEKGLNARENGKNKISRVEVVSIDPIANRLHILNHKN